MVLTTHASSAVGGGELTSRVEDPRGEAAGGKSSGAGQTISQPTADTGPRCPPGSIPAGAGCIDAKPVFIERCPYARLGVAFYRGRYIHHQLVRGAELPTWRKPRNCADARYLAVLWSKRARQSRRLTERYLKRLHQHPKWIALRLLGGNREQWSCLMSIVWVENRTMDPTLDYGGGHGNVYEAYGIPQATPGYKMASAGPDWRTNPETQLRWMIDYCEDRYGSVCGAAYSRRVHGTY